MSTQQPQKSQSQIDESILKQIKAVETGLDSKISLIAAQLTEKMESISSKLASMNSQYENLTSNLSEYKFKLDKVDQFSQFQSKANDLLTTHEIRINTLITDLSNAKYKYDKIFIDNLTVPGYIGEFSKFKNLREYLDSNISQVAMLVSYKEKTDLDLKGYKDKLESLIFQFSQSLNQFNAQQITYCNDIKKETMLHVENKIKDTNEIIEQLKIANGNEALKLRENAMELKKQTEKAILFREDIQKKFNEEVVKFQNSSEEIIKSLDGYKKEFGKIKIRFSELVEFIKDVRFRRNLVNFDGISKREVRELADKIEIKKRNYSPDVKKLKMEKIIDIVDKPLDLDYDVFSGKRCLSISDEEEKKDKFKLDGESTPISDDKTNQTNISFSKFKPMESQKPLSDDKPPKTSYTKAAAQTTIPSTSVNQQTPHYALPTKSQTGTRNHSQSRGIKSFTKFKLGEPQPQIKEKIVTLQFSGQEAFSPNPSFYDNSYNNPLMSNTFYGRQSVKKFGTVQENSKSMNKLLNSAKMKGKGRTCIDCGNQGVNVKGQVEKVLSNLPSEKVQKNVNEICNIFKATNL